MGLTAVAQKRAAVTSADAAAEVAADLLSADGS